MKRRALALLFFVLGSIICVHYLSKTNAKTNGKGLVIGSTLDMKRGAKIFSEHLKNGIMLALQESERQNGINGLVPHVVFRDDEYTPAKARENVLQFLEQGIDIIFSPVGSPTLEKYLDLVEQGKILVLFPGTGAPIFRKPELKYMIHFRASYFDEARVLTRYALEELGAKNLVFFYQDDAFGEGALRGAHSMLQEKEVIDWAEISYPRNSLDFKVQAEEIKKLRPVPDAIIFLATLYAARELIRRLGSAYLIDRNLLGVSDLGEEEFKDFIKGEGLSSTTVNVVPDPHESKLELVKEFRALAKQHNVKIDVTTLEGYINTVILIDILKKIEGPITKEAIIAQAQKMKNYSIKDLEFDYDEDTGQLSWYLWLDTGKGEWIRMKV